MKMGIRSTLWFPLLLLSLVLSMAALAGQNPDADCTLKATTRDVLKTDLAPEPGPTPSSVPEHTVESN
jgi:hypothetical protein